MTAIQTQAEHRAEAERLLPGGVGATGRINSCLGHALYVSRADGCRIWDLDGKEYIDFNLAHGSAFLGYKHPAVRRAVEETLELGVLAGYETAGQAELARRIAAIVPCAEMVRYGNTGSEGTLICTRLARAHTGRNKTLKFWGHFHGLHEFVMYNAHEPSHPVEPGSLIRPEAESAGVPAVMDELIVVIPWKDPAALDRALAEHGEDIAGIIMEPINYNQGCIVADTEYMQLVRDRATANGSVLIYDETLSAFRTGPGCAQEYYGVTPDLCVLGKAVANGGAVVVVAGKEEVMRAAGPGGGVAQSGTYTGNPMAINVTIATVDELTKPGVYDHINAVADRMHVGLQEILDRAKVPAHVQGLAGRFGIHFGTTERGEHYGDTLGRDVELRGRFVRAAAEKGVYFHDYGELVIGHHGVSAAHTMEDVEEALDRVESGVKGM